MNIRNIGLSMISAIMMFSFSIPVAANGPTGGLLYEKPPVVYSEGDEHPWLFEVGDIFTYEKITYRVLSVSDSSKNRGSVEAIGYEKGITDINIPQYISTHNEDFKYKITSIRAGAFKNCKTATNFWISPDSSIRKIPKSMCEGCSKLAIVQLRGRKLREIGSKAFYRCSKLRITQIYPSKLNKIRAKAFKKTHTGMHLQVNGAECIKKYRDKVQKAGAKKVNCYDYDDF